MLLILYRIISNCNVKSIIIVSSFLADKIINQIMMVAIMINNMAETILNVHFFSNGTYLRCFLLSFLYILQEFFCNIIFEQTTQQISFNDTNVSIINILSRYIFCDLHNCFFYMYIF